MTGIITMLASLTISCMPAAEESFRTYTPLPQADSIMFKKDQMQAITDTAYFFWFSDNAELQEADPHAYWLMNRMMQTVQYVKTAEDAVAWTLALNEDVKEYGRRIDRRINDRRAEDAAAQERFGESFDFDRIYEMATLYEAALQNWKAVREQIKSHLPKQKQKSYSEITREINTRLYNNLLRLKKISY